MFSKFADHIRRGGRTCVQSRAGRRLVHRRFRGGAGGRDFDRGDFSCGCADVPGGLCADRLRPCLLQAVERSMDMNIVVWKSPKALRGILRRLFKIKD